MFKLRERERERKNLSAKENFVLTFLHETVAHVFDGNLQQSRLNISKFPGNIKTTKLILL